MTQHRSNYLVNQLISNKLSRAELDEFLAGLHDQDDAQAYSDGLESYFNELLNESEHPPDPDENAKPLLREKKDEP